VLTQSWTNPTLMCADKQRKLGFWYQINQGQKIWVAEFYYGCLEYLFQSYCCWQCAHTARSHSMIDTTSASMPLDEAGRLRAGSASAWGAILAGAAVAIAVSLVLLVLGAGLGFASVSPWPERGISAGGFTVAGTIWLIVTQWLSAGVGGYLAGRLRKRWLATHTHEVFFRDTAHGLVTWSVATLVVATVVASSTAAMIHGVAHAAGGVADAGARGAVMSGMPRGPMGGLESDGGPTGAYDLDKLFRNVAPANQDAGPHGGDGRMEAFHIAASAVANGSVSAEDKAYLSDLVAAKTGATPDDAQKRVDAFIQGVEEASTKAKAAADEARKSAATAALYTALALLIGAFIASVAAVIGGRLRDAHA
jgi:hypothetical protein